MNFDHYFGTIILQDILRLIIVSKKRNIIKIKYKISCKRFLNLCLLPLGTLLQWNVISKVLNTSYLISA